MTLPIRVDKDVIAAFCRKYKVIKFAFFGSILTDRFEPDSDIDVLVDFDPEAKPTLFDMVHMEEELSGMFGRKVDVRTALDLSKYFRDEVVRTAFVQYAA